MIVSAPAFISKSKNSIAIILQISLDILAITNNKNITEVDNVQALIIIQCLAYSCGNYI